MSKLLIIGSNAKGSLESSYAQAFGQLDWTVHFWNPATALDHVARAGKIGRLFSTFVHVEPWARKANAELLQLADEVKPELVLIIGTAGVRPGTLAQLKVRQPKCLLYCIYPDSPHNLDADRIHCLAFCDRVTTSSPAWVEAFEKLGAPQVHYLPFAADTTLHYPAPPDLALAHDVAFIGTWRPERESFLEELARFDLCIWGSDYWKRRTRQGSALPAHWGGRPVTGEEFSQVCSSSKILLNRMDPVTWPGPNMRTFEMPACGAFALCERSDAVLEIFREGETIECFGSIREAKDKIEFYLAHDDARRKIAEASHTFVVQGGHTYLDRAQQVASWFAHDYRSSS